MNADDIYDDFIEKHLNYPEKLRSLIVNQRAYWPENVEDENYNAGTMKKHDGVGLSSIAVINAHSFEKSFNTYKQNNPEMSETEIKARVVFDFLQQHGVPFSYDKNKDDCLFKDDNGQNVTRENFYANMIYNNALTNTNFFDRHIGNLQLLCLEPKSATDTPRNITGLAQKNIDKFMNIPNEERLQILYKRGLYHESIHMAIPTTDERKCDAFALLKTMQEHPKYAKVIFDVYNIQRSKMGYTVGTLLGKREAEKQQAIRSGAMTYLMPNTYKKLERYALNPQIIPQNDADILKLTCELTAQPEFSKEQLAAFAKLMEKKSLTSQDLAGNEIVQSCMAQGRFDNIDKYIASDKKLDKIMSDISAKKQSSLLLTDAQKDKCFAQREVKDKDLQEILDSCMRKIKSSSLGMSILQGASYKEVTDKETFLKDKQNSFAVEKVYIGYPGNVQGGHCGLIAAVNGDKTPENARGEIYINKKFVENMVSSLGKEKGTAYLSNLVAHEFLHGNQRKHIKNTVQDSKSQLLPEKSAKKKEMSAQDWQDDIAKNEKGYAQMILTEAASMAAGLSVCMEVCNYDKDIKNFALQDIKKIGNVDDKTMERLENLLARPAQNETDRQHISRELFGTLVEGQMVFLGERCQKNVNIDFNKYPDVLKATYQKDLFGTEKDFQNKISALCNTQRIAAIQKRIHPQKTSIPSPEKTDRPKAVNSAPAKKPKVYEPR